METGGLEKIKESTAGPRLVGNPCLLLLAPVGHGGDALSLRHLPT